MRGQKIYTEVVYSWTGEVTKANWYEYAGTMELAKADGTAKDTLNQQTALQQQAFNLMQDRQNQVNSSVGKYLSGNVGYDPALLAQLKSQFLNSNAQQYQTAGRNVRTALLRTGSANSSVPAGGDYVRGISGLEGAEANNASSGIANINISNLQQMLSNMFNSASLINGQSAQLASPVSSFTSGVNSALGNYVQAANTGFGSAFSQGLGAQLGKTLGGGGFTFTKQL